MARRTASGRASSTGEDARQAPGDGVLSREEFERVLAECCEAAYRQGWSEGYGSGCRHSKPVLGVPRRELEKWLARGVVVLVVLVVAGPYVVDLLRPW